MAGLFMSFSPKIERALVSVSDKSGLVDFARGLVAAGVEIFASGGTRRHLEEAGIFTRVIFTGNAVRQPMMKGIEYRVDPEGYPNADKVMENGLMLPCHPTMTKDDCEYLYEVLEEFIAKHR